MTHATRPLISSRSRILILAALLGAMLLALTGCAGATTQIQEMGTQAMDGVSAFSMFVAVSMLFYWIAYGSLFGIRSLWPEGYSQIQPTWKPALFITAVAVVGLPAMITWARGIVDAGGFGS